MTAGNQELLHAYHDGELSRLERWKFERRLRRSPELRRELAALRALGRGLRSLDEANETPDLWTSIAHRLPAADSRRAAEADAGSAPRSWAWWLTPIGAAAAATAVVWAILYGGAGGQAPEPAGTVRWIDSGGRSVMVLDDDPNTTIIWVLDSATEGAARGGPLDVV